MGEESKGHRREDRSLGIQTRWKTGTEISKKEVFSNTEVCISNEIKGVLMHIE